MYNSHSFMALRLLENDNVIAGVNGQKTKECLTQS